MDKDADIKVAARRIAWGRFVNAGQTCLAPDYVLVHRSVYSELVEQLKQAIVEFYGKVPLFRSGWLLAVHSSPAQSICCPAGTAAL